MTDKKRSEFIEERLRNVLLEDGPMVRALFDIELGNHVEPCIQRRRNEGADFLLAVTENGGSIAMFFVDRNDRVSVNEEARMRMQSLGPYAYRSNIENIIPRIVEELENGYVFTRCAKLAYPTSL